MHKIAYDNFIYMIFYHHNVQNLKLDVIILIQAMKTLITITLLYLSVSGMRNLQYDIYEPFDIAPETPNPEPTPQKDQMPPRPHHHGDHKPSHHTRPPTQNKEDETEDALMVIGFILGLTCISCCLIKACARGVKKCGARRIKVREEF
jgi:hypothetical protein